MLVKRQALAVVCLGLLRVSLCQRQLAQALPDVGAACRILNSLSVRQAFLVECCGPRKFALCLKGIAQRAQCSGDAPPLAQRACQDQAFFK